MNKISRFLIKRVDYLASRLTADLWVQRTPVETRGCANHTKQRGTRVLRLQSQAPLVLPQRWRPSLAGQAATLELLCRTCRATEGEGPPFQGPSIKLRPVNSPRDFRIQKVPAVADTGHMTVSKPQAQNGITCAKTDTKPRFNTWPNCHFSLPQICHLSGPVWSFLASTNEVICHMSPLYHPEKVEINYKIDPCTSPRRTRLGLKQPWIFFC